MRQVGVALQPGVRLGPYEVIALVDAGGMGEVYRSVFAAVSEGDADIIRIEP
jgi:hypothetical protein